MYEAELLPKCIAIGISYDDFWKMNPRILRVYFEAYDIRRRQQDEMLWLMGEYAFEAVSIALGNAFRKKGSKPSKFRDKPILEDHRKMTGNMSETEKAEEIDKLFASLESSQRLFESANKNDNKKGSTD